MPAELHKVRAILTMKALLVCEEAVCPSCGSPRLPFDSYCRRCTVEAERQWPGVFALASSLELDTGAFPLVDEGSRIL